MEKIRKLIGAFLLMASASSALAAVEGSNLYVAPVWEYGVSKWGNGTEQKGSLWGAALGYTYAKRSGVYFNLEFTGATGRWTGSAGNESTQEYVTESRLGYVAVPWPDKFTVTPFVGLGSYVFNQSSNFKSYFWYMPVGMILEYQINQEWMIGLMGSGASTFAGSYKLNKRGSAPTSTLWKVEIPATYMASSSFNCSIVPFIKKWSYRKNGELIKQDNMYYGLKVALGYNF